MKRADLVKTIAGEAKRQGVAWTLQRHGSRHDVYRLGDEIIPIPRHDDIKNPTAWGIFKECEPQLGQDWWKR